MYDDFIREQNIRLLRDALAQETPPADRAILERLLAQHLLEQLLAQKRGRQSPADRPATDPQKDGAPK